MRAGECDVVRCYKVFKMSACRALSDSCLIPRRLTEDLFFEISNTTIERDDHGQSDQMKPIAKEARPQSISIAWQGMKKGTGQKFNFRLYYG